MKEQGTPRQTSEMIKPIAAMACALAVVVPGAMAHAAPCAPFVSPAQAREALADTAGASEAIALDHNGVPYTTEWVRKGRVARGNEPGKFRSILPWTAIFEAPGNRVRQATVELKEMRLYMLSRKTGKWTLVIASRDYDGGHYLKGGAPDAIGAPLAFKRGPASTSLQVDGRHMDHFWPARGRREIDPADVAGVYASVSARIDPEDFTAGARFLMDMGADYWADNTARFDNFRTNDGVAVGRFKFLTPEWRTFSMTSARAEDLERCLAGAG